jgi:nitrogen regulatory protein PII
VPDKEVDKTIDAIVGAARTGHIGDGKSSVLPIEQSLGIRTDETEEAAL